jgi:hypothetical protein
MKLSTYINYEESWDLEIIFTSLSNLELEDTEEFEASYFRNVRPVMHLGSDQGYGLMAGTPF